MTPSPTTWSDAWLGERLRAQRVQAGLTVREAAAQAQIAHSLIVKYENGSVRPTLPRLAALATAYGVTLAALLSAHDALVPLITALDRADPATLPIRALLDVLDR